MKEYALVLIEVGPSVKDGDVLMTLAPGARSIANRALRFSFDGIGKDDPNSLSCEEEYRTAIRAKEMYRDAALDAGKWPLGHT